MPSKKHIVYLSGATGFIGSRALKCLVEGGYPVRISHRQGSRMDNIEPWIKHVEVLRGDLADPSFAKACVSGCDGVIHLAGWVNTSVDPRFERQVIDSNYTTTRNVFEACAAAKVLRVVFLGSIFGLGRGDGNQAANEHVTYNLHDLAARVPYARAKRQCEDVRDEYAKKGVPIVTVYPNFCFGEGDVYLSSSRALVPFLKGQLRFYLDGGINVQSVDDAARSLVLGLEKGKTGEKYLSGGENMEYRALYETLSRATGIPAPRKGINPEKFAILYRFPRWLLVRLERMARGISGLDLGMALIAVKRHWYYSDAKIRKELGYRSRPAEQTLKEATDWLKPRLRAAEGKK